MERAFKDLKLTNKELDRLEKAFKDPEFCKLFSEYADELNDPENKRRYEEEIKLVEQQRGMDVKFIKPTPHHVLKSRNWPTSVPPEDMRPMSKDVSKLMDGQKIFINICSSDILAKPEMVQKSRQGAHWSIPHSFSPPQEDIDKEKATCIVCDVVFHPEAITLAEKTRLLRNLLHTTAIEGVVRQFGFFLGLTKEHAELVWSSTSKKNDSAERQTRILTCFRILKGIQHKGSLRPTVIRKKRENFDECQRRMAEEEQAAIEEAKKGPTSKESLAALAKLKATVYGDSGNNPFATPNGDPAPKYKTPVYKILHSSDFDMQNYTNDPGAIIPSRPNTLKIEIFLPGIHGAACLDLDVTSNKIHVQSEKPEAYKLDIDLPYPIDSEKGTAKFNKADNKLLLTMPVISLSPVQLSARLDLPSLANLDEFQAQKTGVKLVEVLPPPKNDISEDQMPKVSPTEGNKKRRRRKKKRSNSGNQDKETDQESSEELKEDLSSKLQDTEVDKKPTEPIETCRSVKFHKVLSSSLVVPKENSFAPARFRQDPLSFTMLLAIKNVVSESLELFWSPTVSISTDSPPLRLMVTCVSRGSGGCSLGWGVVMHCPAEGAPTIDPEKMKGKPEDELNTSLCDKKEKEEAELASDIGKPELVCCDVTATNVTLTFYKPQTQRASSDSRLPWWESIAVGRALGPGLQKVPVVGLLPLSTELANLSKLSSEFDAQTPLQIPSNFRISVLPDQTIEIGVPTTPLPPITEVPITKEKSEAETNMIMSSVSTDPESKAIPLKGILKQRSTSESSIDEFHPHIGTSTCDLGPFSSGEFPTASNSDSEAVAFPPSTTLHSTNQAVSPSSTEELVSDTAVTIPAKPKPRQRRLSVNFSHRDERIAFSPMDTIDTLHNLIKAKQKNFRRSERRRRNNSYPAPRITLSELQSIPGPPLNSKKKRQFKPGTERRQEQVSESHDLTQTQSPSDLETLIVSHKTHSLPVDEDDSGLPSSQSPVVSLSSESKESTNPSGDGSVGKQVNSDGGGILNWQELPSVQKKRNPHATVCPVALNADVIFELDDDDGC